MKRMERPMVTGPVSKHFDLERKSARQAEARLSQRLQRLEHICLYHMKLLIREQRQLQKELQRLQQGRRWGTAVGASVFIQHARSACCECGLRVSTCWIAAQRTRCWSGLPSLLLLLDIKKKLSSYLGNGIQKRPDVFVPLPPGEQKHGVPQANKVRALATNMTQEIYKTKSQMPPFHHAGLKDSVKSKEQALSQNYKASHFRAEKPQALQKDCLSPPKGKDSNKGIAILCQDQDVSVNTLDQGPGSSPDGESGKAHTDEARSKDASPKPDPSAGRQGPLSPRECAGNLKDEPVTPTFSELFLKVRNAHYLRHRVPPESDRLLSIGEIFGHKEPFQPGGQGGLPSSLTT